MINEEIPIPYRVLISILALVIVWALFFVICSFGVIYKKRVEILTVNNGHHVYIQYGDIFDAQMVLNSEERRNIVIPVNRCFDTLVNNDLISMKTLHGMAMEQLYSSGRFDHNTLNYAIQKNLSFQNIVSEDIKFEDKPAGNLKRFPVGTVAEIQVNKNCTYFFLALSTFDSNLHANISDEEYVLALIRLLKFSNIRSQKYPVVIPLIGAGVFEGEKNEKSILEYIIKLINLNKNLINNDIHIVIRDNGKENISITNIK